MTAAIGLLEDATKLLQEPSHGTVFKISLNKYFQRIGPLGRFFLQVEMSVCLFVQLCVCVCLSVRHSVQCPNF